MAEANATFINLPYPILDWGTNTILITANGNACRFSYSLYGQLIRNLLGRFGSTCWCNTTEMNNFFENRCHSPKSRRKEAIDLPYLGCVWDFHFHHRWSGHPEPVQIARNLTSTLKESPPSRVQNGQV